MKVTDILITLCILCSCICGVVANFEPTANDGNNADQQKRYVTWRINPGEGMNLRKDVLLRMVSISKHFKHRWTLVLPPLRYVPHWNESPHISQVTEEGDRKKDNDRQIVRFVRWEDLIDLSLLQRFVDIISYEQFLEENGPDISVGVNILPRKNINFSKPLTLWTSPCGEWNADNAGYDPLTFENAGEMWHSTPLYAKTYECLIGPASIKHLVSFMDDHFAPMADGVDADTTSQGNPDEETTESAQETLVAGVHETIAQALPTDTSLVDDEAETESTITKTRTVEMESSTNAGDTRPAEPFSVLLSRVETLMWHVMWHTEEYWEARTHYVFAAALREEAAQFMQTYGVADGNYLAIHMRRRDFVFSKQGKIPELTDVATIIKGLMDQQGVTKVFVATDAPESELEELGRLLSTEVLNYKYKVAGKVTPKQRETHLADGQLAVIDQILCSRAKYFSGSFQSTFSNTIFEERTLLGYDYDTTYNYICPLPSPENPENGQGCTKPTRWLSPSPVSHFVPNLGSKTTGENEREHMKDEL